MPTATTNNNRPAGNQRPQPPSEGVATNYTSGGRRRARRSRSRHRTHQRALPGGTWSRSTPRLDAIVEASDESAAATTPPQQGLNVCTSHAVKFCLLTSIFQGNISPFFTRVKTGLVCLLKKEELGLEMDGSFNTLAALLNITICPNSTFLELYQHDISICDLKLILPRSCLDICVLEEHISEILLRKYGVIFGENGNCSFTPRLLWYSKCYA